MEDGFVQVAFVLANHAHPNMGDIIFGAGGKHALKYIGRVAEALAFQKGFPKQPVGFQAFGIGFQDVAAVGDGFVIPAAVNLRLNVAQVVP